MTLLDRLLWRLAYAAILAGLLLATLLAAAGGAVLALWLGDPGPLQILAAATAGMLPRAALVAWARRGP